MFTIRLITQINRAFVLKYFSEVSKYKHLEKSRQLTVIVKKWFTIYDLLHPKLPAGHF